MFLRITDVTTIVPKKCHVVNFQSAPMHHSPYIERCKKSRETFLSSWEIKQWTEDDFLEIVRTHQWHIPFAEHMLSEGYWAIISDIIRMYALHTEGGLYVDWDVEFVREVPEEMRSHMIYIGFEPYTLNGQGTSQLGMQCCLSVAGHSFWSELFTHVRDTLWSAEFDILPGSATKVLEREFGLSPTRNGNVYYYLSEGICIAPHDVLYPFMGTRGKDGASEIEGEIVYNKIQSHTIALHWEYSQIKNAGDEKQGWTNYLYKLRIPPKEHGYANV